MSQSAAWGLRSVVNDAGQLRTVYRGQHGLSEGIEHRLPSISFGSLSAAQTYANRPNNAMEDTLAPKVFAAHLNLTKPLVDTPNDPFLEMRDYERAMGRENALRLAKKFAYLIEETDNWSDIKDDYGVASVAEYLALNEDYVLELYCLLYPILDDAEEVRFLADAGIDGAIYAGSGAGNAGEPEYRVFSVEQIRIIP